MSEGDDIVKRLMDYDRCHDGDVDEAADEIVSLRQRLAEAQAKLAVASSFCDVRKCRGCDGYYPDGYVCQCGEDNSYEQEAAKGGRE